MRRQETTMSQRLPPAYRSRQGRLRGIVPRIYSTSSGTRVREFLGAEEEDIIN